LPSVQQSIRAEDEEEILQIALDPLPISYKQLAKETGKDEVGQSVKELIRTGWPRKATGLKDILKPFFPVKDELTVFKGCILRGCRVFVPRSMQGYVLGQLHSSHPGVVKMKLLSRKHVWWPNLGKDIEKVALECEPCHIHADSPPAAPVHHWEIPDKSWDRVHLDHAGPFQSKIFLILQDVTSKWPEIFPVSSTSSQASIRVLDQVFARFGFPKEIVSDNGSSFASSEFQNYCRERGIKNIFISPYHPRGNGVAERLVRTFKSAMKKAKEGSMDLDFALNDFLAVYRGTPHVSTNKSPAESFLRFKIRNKLSQLNPKQEFRKKERASNSGSQKFQVNQKVWVRSFRPGKKWIPATIVQILGPLTYKVQGDFGVWKRHQDHLTRASPGQGAIREKHDSDESEILLPFDNPGEFEEQGHEGDVCPQQMDQEPHPEAERGGDNPIEASPCPTIRRSTRERKPPERYRPG
jgi:hypothetical protein